MFGNRILKLPHNTKILGGTIIMGVNTYKKYKEQGLCPRCGKTHTGGVACEPCRAKIREYQRGRIMDMNEEQYRDYLDGKVFSSKKRKLYLKDNNLCVECGKVEVENLSRCPKCRQVHNTRQRKYYKINKNA